jgi:hypothetical protein
MAASALAGRPVVLGGLAVWLLLVYMRDLSNVMDNANAVHQPKSGSAQPKVSESVVKNAPKDEFEEYVDGVKTSVPPASEGRMNLPKGRVVISFCSS